MANDLSRGTCPAAEIKCLVIDEAHKALGNHAYCQVVWIEQAYTLSLNILLFKKQARWEHILVWS